jgi:hypothetical protein
MKPPATALSDGNPFLLATDMTDSILAYRRVRILPPAGVCGNTSNTVHLRPQSLPNPLPRGQSLLQDEQRI